MAGPPSSVQSFTPKQRALHNRIGLHDPYVPSAENDFTFKYESPSGRSAAELNKLLRPGAKPAKFPHDRNTAMPLSYGHVGALPPAGLADKFLEKMEERHEKNLKEQGGKDGEETDEYDDEEADGGEGEGDE